MTEPMISVTIHDRFNTGDTVRLVHVDEQRNEFVTEQTLIVPSEMVSATFITAAPRHEVIVIIDRTQGEATS